MYKIIFALIYLVSNSAFAASQTTLPDAPIAEPIEEELKIKRSEDIGDCQKLGDMLDKCKPYRCQMPHPQANKFMIDHEIIGFKTDELLCHHTQTIPGNGIIDCKYSRAMRKVMVKQFRSQDDLTQDDLQILSDSFAIYCKVIE